MAQVNRNNLKTYFQSGNVPTQSNFENLIDSTFNITDDTIDVLSGGTTNKFFVDKVDVTYSELVNLITTSGLTTSQTYQLTDYDGTHYITYYDVNSGDFKHVKEYIPTPAPDISIVPNAIGANSGITYFVGTSVLFGVEMERALLTDEIPVITGDDTTGFTVTIANYYSGHTGLMLLSDDSSGGP
jgi:hypothetical protein